MYSIKAAAQAAGLTVETLRAWERRYGAVTPGRDSSGRRSYTAEDVIRLRRLREGTDRGHPIGRLARLPDAELTELLHEPPGGRDDASGALVERILEAVRQFRAADCEQALALAVGSLSPQCLIGDVLTPVLREVGERWHRGEFSIAQERLVSSAVRRQVGLVVDTYDRAARADDIVFATLPGERHELGLLMSALTCASRGCRAHYLGPELPAVEIARYARAVNASAIAVSVVNEPSLADLTRELQALVSDVGSGANVWVGGAATLTLDAASLPQGCHLVRDQLELERRLDTLRH